MTAPVLPEGFQYAVAVVVGQPDSPPLPGLASSLHRRVPDRQDAPQITGASFTQGGAALPLPNGPAPNITTISSLTHALAQRGRSGQSARPRRSARRRRSIFDALNPTTADEHQQLLAGQHHDQHATSRSTSPRATFVAEPATVNADRTYIIAYNGWVNLTFTPGLPAGQYEFVAHTTRAPVSRPHRRRRQLPRRHRPSPARAPRTSSSTSTSSPRRSTSPSMALESTYSANGSTVIGGAQSYFELPPASGTNTRDNVRRPQQRSSSTSRTRIPYAQLLRHDVLLIGSANTPACRPTAISAPWAKAGSGSTGTGFTIVTDTTVTLYNYNVDDRDLDAGRAPAARAIGWSSRSPPAPRCRPTITASTCPTRSSPAAPTRGSTTSTATSSTAKTSATRPRRPAPTSPTRPSRCPEYEDLQTNGTYRMDDMSGDGVAGGAFMTGFTVVPYGNVVYARPDYVENPLVPSTLSNGSLANPYPGAGARGRSATRRCQQSDHNPNLGLNNRVLPARQLQHGLRLQRRRRVRAVGSSTRPRSSDATIGPVGDRRRRARPSAAQPDHRRWSPRRASCCSAPAGNNSGVTDGSASVPFNTTLVFQAGLDAQAQNASLFVQNQGSALQAHGTAIEPGRPSRRTTTRRVGGATNDNPDTTPHSGDWGGIVFRNYDEADHVPAAGFPGGRHPGRAQRRRGRLRRSGCDVDPELRQHPLRRRRRAAGLERLLQRDHALQLPADDHQRQHLQHRRHRRHRGGHRRRHGLVPRGRHGPRAR